MRPGKRDGALAPHPSVKVHRSGNGHPIVIRSRSCDGLLDVLNPAFMLSDNVPSIEKTEAGLTAIR
uniref:Uncharacterized protein n=1 Tax=Hyaloperonospora arabidopsidis (strain Emoy2) TaxID=559515 RepID=M4BRA3_HYAAE